MMLFFMLIDVFCGFMRLAQESNNFFVVLCALCAYVVKWSLDTGYTNDCEVKPQSSRVGHRETKHSLLTPYSEEPFFTFLQALIDLASEPCMAVGHAFFSFWREASRCGY